MSDSFWPAMRLVLRSFHKGEFDVTVGGKFRRLFPGEGTVVPAEVEHTLTTGEGSRLIEVWYPVKEEDTV